MPANANIHPNSRTPNPLVLAAAIFILLSACASAPPPGGTIRREGSPSSGLEPRDAENSGTGKPGVSGFVAAGSPWAAIPGLEAGFVPQGIAADEAGRRVVVSGWFADGSPSALYVIDSAGGQSLGSIRLQRPDGTSYTGHAGGVAVNGGSVYVSSESRLWRMPLSELDAGLRAGTARFDESIPVPTRASFCCASGGVLWVGDFERGSAYPTEPFRRSTARDGDRRKAWAAGYRLSDSDGWAGKPRADSGEAIPDMILTIIGSIQGMALAEGRVMLSRSFGRTAPSTLLSYDDPTGTPPHAFVEFGGIAVPMWHLDSFGLRGRMAMPPMSEGLATLDGKALALFESAARPYLNIRDPRSMPTDRIWSIDLTLIP